MAFLSRLESCPPLCVALPCCWRFSIVSSASAFSIAGAAALPLSGEPFVVVTDCCTLLRVCESDAVAELILSRMRWRRG